MSETMYLDVHIFKAQPINWTHLFYKYFMNLTIRPIYWH